MEVSIEVALVINKHYNLQICVCYDNTINNAILCNKQIRQELKTILKTESMIEHPFLLLPGNSFKLILI